jgi:hypothetical protein
MKIIALILGAAALLLGGLWLLQGLGAVHIEPVACVGACEPLEGPSTTWAIIGFVVALAGVLAITFALRRRVPK